MAFDIRCPECKAKLRLDEAPDPDSPIECPRCGSQFAAPAPDRPAPAGGNGRRPKEKKKDGMPKRKKARKKKTNPAILLIAIGVGFAALIGVGALMVWMLNRAGKVEEMLSHVPGECNLARGINLSQLSRYPGYADQVGRHHTIEVKNLYDPIAKAAGHNPDAFLDYMIVARQRGSGGSAVMYVFRTQNSFSPATIAKNLPGASEFAVNGQTCYRTGRAVVYMPTSRIIVVVPAGRGQEDLVRGSTAAKGNKSASFAAALDDTARLAVRGSIWLVVRATGGLKGYPGSNTQPLENDFGKLHKQASTAQTFAVWTSPGGTGVRLGAAIECSSSKEARDLVKYMQDGPMGKADESEPPASLRSGFSMISDKKSFGEFMQYLEYKTKGNSAYMVSKVSGDNAARWMDMFNNPNMATGESASFGGPAGFGAGVGGPPGGAPGPPGGLAPPGMGPGR
jgi:hypothetical protein